MRRLREIYADDPRVQTLRTALIDNRDLTLGACHGGLVPVLVAAVAAGFDAPWPRLIVSGDPAGLVDDLEELGVVAAQLPELDHFEETADDDGASDRTNHNRRVAAIEAYAKGALLVASPRSVAQPVPDLTQVARSSIAVRAGDSHDLHKLVDRLVEAGYKVTSVVEGRGELAVRGGIVDVYPWIGDDALRIEFFGDEIDAIRRFDPFTQESIAKADEAVLATAAGSLALGDVWSQLPAGPVLVLADVPLRGRLKKDHGRREIRLARQLEEGATDGASLGVDRFKGDLRHGLQELRRALEEAGGTHLVLFARNEEAKRELAGHCGDHDITADIRTGRLSQGYRDLERDVLVLHDFELAERQPVRRRNTRIAGGAPLSSLTDLKRGDHVVHLKHGIGVFRGMATLEKRGFLEDYLVLEFAEGSKLYVPVDAIDLVQKYVGATGARPDLAKIGGIAWAKKRAKAEKAIEDLSAELLEQQARRITAGGIAFEADGPEQRRFEAQFPYEETEDQLAATREIKADMERAVAMDRLLCGDVGFGKTEVAMRAAFKAVAAGYQVAMLAPTTLLAEQHVESFTDRFAGFDAEVAGLNRFSSASERAAVIERVRSGEIDILIGTHALLTDKLRFAKLGLLIIDEEHRFGVKHKEKLRVMRDTAGTGDSGDTSRIEHAVATTEPATAEDAPAAARASAPTTVQPQRRAANSPATSLDVLTLSATPIPRTLHFSLLGLRDISVLAEAPSERLAVETRVAPWDNQLIKTALAREFERNGQVFFVHNRVQDLDGILFKLSRIDPEMRVEMVHGQMPEERITRVMTAYKQGAVQCLVTTSIIESGIDIRNANTLFVNNAHCFGLAELHQIRGRIGRHHHQAYAYFLTPGNKELTEEARERLNAIQEYAELGAGFKLAMRDLELRGAGNLLGGEQSGHIDAIGYELYTRLLHETVDRLKAQVDATARPDQQRTVAAPRDRAEERQMLGMKVDAYIPDTYLETPALKFEIHKSLDACRRLSDIAGVARSVRDRFGALVDPIARLFQVRAIRLRCSELGITRIEVQDRQLRLHLTGQLPAELARAQLPELVHLQLDGPVVVLFLKPQLDQDTALGICCRLLGIDTGFLGRGF